MRSDRTVTWLASWTENVQNATKYVMLNPSSKLKVSRALTEQLGHTLRQGVPKVLGVTRPILKSHCVRKPFALKTGNLEFPLWHSMNESD